MNFTPGKGKAVVLALCSTVSLTQILPVLADSPATATGTTTGASNKQIAAVAPESKSTDKSQQAPAGTTTGAQAATATGTPATTAGAMQGTPQAVPTTTGADTADGDALPAAPKLMLKPGQPLVLGSETEDVQPTDDVNLAREQALHFPDNAEASFILAVALTRTSRVEEALQEVRRARRLAQAAGGPAYFDKMIKSYEEMLQSVDDPRVRYSLAWAYYMKAYLLAQDSRRAQMSPVPPIMPAAPTAAAIPAATPAPSISAAPTATPAVPQPAVVPQNTTVPNTVSAKAEKKKIDPTLAIGLLNSLNPGITAKMVADGGKIPAAQLPSIPTAIQKAAPAAVPQIHQYYAEALKNLDAVLAKKPDDVWALLYRWHLYAEDTGNLGEAMRAWKEAEHRFPNNPGVHLFLAEGYVKEGNLKEGVVHASKAVFLRGLGN